MDNGSERSETDKINRSKRQAADYCCVLLQYTRGFFTTSNNKGTTQRCHPKHKFPHGWHITQSKNHWSNEDIMVEYIKNIVLPYVNSNREDHNKAAVIITDNFKGQVTSKVTDLLEQSNIHTCLLPPNTTDRLQPLDLAVNTPAKEFLRQKFQEWYAQQVAEQIRVRGCHVAIEPVNLQ